MRRRGWAHAAKLIGAGSGNAPDRWLELLAFQQHGMGDRVGGAAQSHTVLTAGRGFRRLWQARQDHRERAGPERVNQLLRKHRHFLGVAGDAGGIGHVHDQWVVGGATLGRENFRDGCVIVRVCGQAVDGFSGQAEQFAALQCRRSGLDRCGQASIQNHDAVLAFRTARCPEWPPPSTPWRAPLRASLR